MQKVFSVKKLSKIKKSLNVEKHHLKIKTSYNTIDLPTWVILNHFIRIFIVFSMSILCEKKKVIFFDFHDIDYLI